MTGIKGYVSWGEETQPPLPKSFFSEPTVYSDANTSLQGSNLAVKPWGWVLCDSPHLESGRIAEQWETDQEKLVTSLHGAFSFLIWDQERSTLFAARDRFGIIPLCFCFTGSGIVFASHLSELAAHGELRGGPDRIMIAEYLLSLGDAPALPEQTFFSGIKRLPPAHSMTLRQGGRPRFQRYWDLSIPETELNISDADAIAQCRELLLRATADVISSDARTGIFASGGLDSSVLAATTRSVAEKVPDLLFLKAPVEKNDESEWLTELAASGPYPVHERMPQGAFTELESMLDILAEPWGYENLHHDFLLFREAQRQSCTRIVSGYYGDVVVDATLDYLLDLAQQHDWETFQEELTKAESIQGIPAESYLWRYAGGVFEEMARSGQWRQFQAEAKDVCDRFKLSMKPMIWHWWLRPVTPKPLRKLYRVVTGTQRPVWWELNRQINPTFATSVDADMRAQEMKSSWTLPPISAKESHRNVITHTSTALALEQMAALGNSQNVQATFPFINESLIDFALALPRNLHCRDGWDRWILRKAMDPDLPNSICWRQGRTNYAATAQFELQKESDRINALITDWPAALSEYINQTMFLSDWEWYRQEAEVSLESAAAGRRIFRTYLLAKWLERYG